MKNNKVFLLLFVLICSISVNVQSQSDWSTSGNSISDGNFLGSTNNIDLKFKVNNQLGGLINMSAYNTFLGYTAGNAITSGTNNTFKDHQGGLSIIKVKKAPPLSSSLHPKTILIIYLSKISDAFINTFFNNLTHYKILKILDAYCSSRFVAKSLIKTINHFFAFNFLILL